MTAPEVTVGMLSIKIAEMDRRLTERFEQQQQSLARAEDDLRAWKIAQNEWRGTVSDLTGRFLTVDRYEVSHQALVERYEQGHAAVVARQNDVIARLSRVEGADQKQQFNVTNLIALLAAVAAVAIGILALIRS